MFEAICDHIRYATNKGNIRSAITVFPQKTSQVTYRCFLKFYIFFYLLIYFLYLGYGILNLLVTLVLSKWMGQ
jgi:nitric oxide synthase oxygenase domain/subunit